MRCENCASPYAYPTYDLEDGIIREINILCSFCHEVRKSLDTNYLETVGENPPHLKSVT